MRGDDGLTDQDAKPQPIHPSGGDCIEKFVLDGGMHPWTIIMDTHIQDRAVTCRLNFDFTAALSGRGDGLDRIVHQIDDHLFYLNGITIDNDAWILVAP